MENPKISVIVPVYKAEPYLHRCLDSVIGQTYEHLEIILVDDGSPDRCGAICDEYAERDARIVVIHTENRGAYAARNTALDAAHGAFIAFVDADDWLDPDLYEVLLELLQTHDADIAQCEMKNEGTYEQLRCVQLGRTVVYEQGQLTSAFFEEGITHGLLNKLFRAEIWADLRFDERYYHVDAMTLAGIEAFCSRFVRTDQCLYHYNTTNPSITRGKRNPLHITSMEVLFETFSEAAGGDPQGSLFICREIPSAGRLILPGGEITLRTVMRHIRAMHYIFIRHWDTAKTARSYQAVSNAKKILWHIYRYCPIAASVLMYFYGKMK